MSQDWGNLFFKLSLAEALEEVAARVAEEAWLYNEYSFNICFYYIQDSNLSSYIRFSKITPSLFTLKEGSTSHLGLLPSGKKRETALRCSEPLRSKVVGPSKVFAMFCGMGPP